MVTKIGALSRVAMLLAASNLTDREIQAVVRALRETAFRELLEVVSAYRAELVGPSIESEAVTFRDEASSRSTGAMSDEVASQVERLLLLEGNLTRLRAAELMSGALQSRNPNAKPVPYNSKEGFSRWLKQLGAQYSVSEILHVASRIRNLRMHANVDDWIEKS